MASADADAVLETHALTKRFGSIVAVDDLSLRVPRGGVFGLLGPNGSGKTTTIAMLLGLIRPSSGSLSLFGEHGATPSKEALRRTGSVIEAPAFYPHLSGRANLRFFQGISNRGPAQDVDHLLELVGLADRAESKYQTYSLGMKQRVGIACALLGEPELVFLDEPTNGLDPAGIVDVRALIKRLGAGGRTIVLSSHQLHEVEEVCDSVAIIGNGRLITQGRVQELVKRPESWRINTTNDAVAQSVIGGVSGVAEVRFIDGHIVAQVLPDLISAVSRTLAEAGIYVTLMEPIQISLEDFFLEVTKDSGLRTRLEAIP
jgi:ABC-type multidrug transport system ATPase subunit